MSRFAEYLETKGRLVTECLPRLVPPRDQYPPSVHEAIHYSLASGGKRLRPVLALAAHDICGGQEETAMLPIACSLELIHTYSLIHDDLPLLDDDDLRRGKPSCHVKFGVDVAILAGNALLAMAFHTIMEAGRGTSLRERTPRICAMIAHAAGIRGMVGGQMVDVESEGKTVSEDTVRFIHAHKTGALLRASLLAGAMAADARAPVLKAIGDYGAKIGLAFQIVDDILDVEGDPALMGKPVGSDENRQKVTFPAVFGMDKARQEALELKEAAQTRIRGALGNGRADLLVEAADFIINRAF